MKQKEHPPCPRVPAGPVHAGELHTSNISCNYEKKQQPIQPQVDGYKVVYKRKLQISERCCQGAALIDTEENCCEYFIQTEGLAKFTVMLKHITLEQRQISAE